MVDNEKDKVAELKQKYLSYKTTAEKIKEDEQLYFQFKKYILWEKFSKEVANINDEDVLDTWFSSQNTKDEPSKIITNVVERTFFKVLSLLSFIQSTPFLAL